MKLVAARRAAAVASLLLLPALAHAQLFRAYLSSKGDDGNPCTALLPCRLVPAAVAAVADGGEIWMLDSANYNAGTVAIAKNLAIVAVPGQAGSILTIHDGPAIATSGTANVKLRNVIIASGPSFPGYQGIAVGAGTTVSVEDSVFDIWLDNGIVAGFAVRVDSGGTFSAANSTFRGGASRGVAIVAQGDARVDLVATSFYRFPVGVDASNAMAATTTRIAVNRCTFSNIDVGLRVASNAAAGEVRAGITASTFASGNYGLWVDSTSGSASVATVTGSLFTANTSAGIFVSGNPGASVETMGDNVIRHNGTDVVGTPSSVPRI